MATLSVRWLACLLVCGCGRVGFDGVAIDAPPGGASPLSYPTDDVNAVLGVTSLSLVPTYSGTAVFSIVPALPQGLDLDSQSGAITGVPSEVADGITYRVTAAAGGHDDSASFALTVLPGFVADAIADGSDDDAGVDGVCHSSAGGGCTLRAALQTVNRRTAKQLILLDAAVYTVTAGLDTVTADLVIAGQGSGATRVQPSVVHPGYGLVQMIANHQLTLKKAAFANFGMHDGGVVSATAGTTVVDACSFTNNIASSSGGVFFFSSGAVAAIRRSTFTQNTANPGNGWGGVIDGEGAGTTIVVEQCTAVENEAVWGAFSHITTGTTLRLENSTLYGNKSTTAGTLATPGGIYTLVNDTIVGNTNTNPTSDSAGLYLYNAPCHYTVANTIVAFNTDVNRNPHNCNRRDLTTSLTSNGGNVFSSDAENCGMYFTAPGDRLMTDPQLVAGARADADDHADPDVDGARRRAAVSARGSTRHAARDRRLRYRRGRAALRIRNRG
jgi:hypothetical protein